MLGNIDGARSRRWFVVVVHDPQTGETDAYGPMGEWQAVVETVKRRREFDAEDLDDVFVLMVTMVGFASDWPRPRLGPSGTSHPPMDATPPAEDFAE